ncbi:MAG TPA: polysaccharide biosynthesis C-terminal domain-containing protein [Myxococcales bacterium]
MSFARARPLIVSRFFVAVASAVLPLVLARRFSPADYGTYKQLFLVAQTLFYVLQLGVPQSLYYFVPRTAHRRPYLVHALVFLAGAGVLAAAALVWQAPRVAGWMHNPELARHAPALAVYLFGTLCSVPLEISLTASGRTRAASAFYAGSELLRAAAMTLPAVLGWGVQGVMAGVAGWALLRAAVTWAVVPRGTSGPWLAREGLWEQLRYALPFGAAIAVGLPQGYFHQYFVAAHEAPAAFAVYSVGLFQVPFVDLLYSPTSEVLMVSLGELDREGRLAERAGVFRGAVARLAYAFVPLAVFLGVAAPSFISALFTEKYLAAVPIFRVGVASVLLAALPLEGVLRARGETWHILAASALKAVVNVPAVVVGVWRFGLVGAVGAWLASEVVGKAALLWRVPRALGAPLRRLMPWAELGRAAFASLAGAAAAWAAQAAFAGLRPIAVLVLGAALFGVAYALALLAVGARLPFEMVGLGRLAPRPVLAPTKTAGP